jgi:hypothetical protein
VGGRLVGGRGSPEGGWGGLVGGRGSPEGGWGELVGGGGVPLKVGGGASCDIIFAYLYPICFQQQVTES